MKYEQPSIKISLEIEDVIRTSLGQGDGTGNGPWD